MNESVSAVAAFSSDNIERIYRGEPARTPSGDVPEAVLSPRQFEITGLAAAGLPNEEIAEVTGLTYGTVKNHMYLAFQKLGVAGRSSLIAYFPVEAGDDVLQGKKIQDIYRGPRSLRDVEALSTGASCKDAAQQRGITLASFYANIKFLSDAWPDAQGAVKLPRVVNGLRALHIRTLEEHRGKRLSAEAVASLTLPALVRMEPDILAMAA